MDGALHLEPIVRLLSCCSPPKLGGHHDTCEDQFGERGGDHHHQLGGFGSRKSKQGPDHPARSHQRQNYSSTRASRNCRCSRPLFPCRRVQNTGQPRQRLARRRRSGLHRGPDWRRPHDHKDSEDKIIKNELSLLLKPPHSAASLFCNTRSATKSAKPTSSPPPQAAATGARLALR